MLGFDSVGVFLAYTLSIFSTLVCIVYGIVYWNSPKEDETKEIEEEMRWEKKDDEIAEQL